MDKIGLKAFIAPHTPTAVQEFLANEWPHQPFLVHGLGETIQSITRLPFLSSLGALLNAWPTSVQAHLPDVSDESSAVDVSSRDAKKLFDNKMGLLFNDVQNISPLLAEWLQVIRSELGLPHSTYARCMVYATPHGKGTTTHFDQNVNFVLQLQGVKKWRLAPNFCVVNPTQRFTAGQPLDPELASYAHDEMLDVMPDDHFEYTLSPGSLLFVPRGFWHSTEADGEALALNFTFSQPNWVDLFTAALRSRLLLSPQWRELADGVTAAQTERKFLAEQKLEMLLKELVEDLPNWNAADILASTEGE